MVVQLLPFQKLDDIPDVAQRHRRVICGLAITSIVLISLLLFLFVATLIATSATYLYTSKILLIMFGIPSMMLLFILVLVSSVISLRNADKWASTDVCCNLMRPHPACCTKYCGGNKHCCARLSCVHAAASIFTSLMCVFLVAVLVFGCVRNPCDSGYNSYNGYSSYYHHDYYRHDYPHDNDWNYGTTTHATYYHNARALSTHSGYSSYYPHDYYRHDYPRNSYDSYYLSGHGNYHLARENSTLNKDWNYDSYYHLARENSTLNKYSSYYASYSYYNYPGNYHGQLHHREHPRDNDWSYSSYAPTTPHMEAFYAPPMRGSYNRAYDVYGGTTTTTPHTKPYYYRAYDAYDGDSAYHEYDGGYRRCSACAILSMFEVPSIILLVCLAIITARSAWLIRQIEDNQPEIPLLPPQKMVVLVQHVDRDMVVVSTTVAADDCAIPKEKTKTEVPSEQNV